MNTCSLRPLQGIGPRIVADHGRDLGIRDLSCLHAVDDSLEICSAAGNQYSDL